MSRESASDVFFHTEVSGDKSMRFRPNRFSPNTLKLMFDAGKNYFVRQYIKVGAFVGGADLELIPGTRQRSRRETGMAAPGTCGS
jgi:hypothetical protein